jgi:hypothetical protein
MPGQSDAWHEVEVRRLQRQGQCSMGSKCLDVEWMTARGKSLRLQQSTSGSPWAMPLDWRSARFKAVSSVKGVSSRARSASGAQCGPASYPALIGSKTPPCNPDRLEVPQEKGALGLSYGGTCIPRDRCGYMQYPSISACSPAISSGSQVQLQRPDKYGVQDRLSFRPPASDRRVSRG